MMEVKIIEENKKMGSLLYMSTLSEKNIWFICVKPHFFGAVGGIVVVVVNIISFGQYFAQDSWVYLMANIIKLRYVQQHFFQFNCNRSTCK